MGIGTSIQRNFQVICDPSSQLLHSFLFLFCAVVTIVYLAMFLATDNTVFLSNFDLLSNGDFMSLSVPMTKDALLQKWQCANNNTRVDRNWGPDSICKCFSNKECAADKGCANVEDQCYATVVPAYAHVFAGVDNSYFNIVIAFLFIHISVLLNMTIPLLQSKVNEQNGQHDDYKGPVQTSIVNGYAGKATIDSHFDNFAAGNNKKRRTPDKPQTPQQPNQQPKKTEVTNTTQDPRNSSQVKPTGAVQSDNGETKGIEESDCLATLISEHVTNNLWVRFALLLVLSGFCLVFTGMAMTHKTNKAGENQECDLSSCMTQTFTTILTWVVSSINLVLAIYLLVSKFWVRTVNHAVNVQDGSKKSQEFYKQLHITVAHMFEDITIAAAFMLLVSTFSAHGGTHDDTTLFLDVALIAFIAFMLRLQHDIMLCREDVITCCNETTNVYTDSMGKKHSLNTQVMSYFLNTRLFIFVVVIGSSFVFIERLQATTGVLDTHTTWNQSMRLLVLFTSILPNLCSDASYELVHVSEMRKSGTHTAYVGPQIWRRTIYLGYVLVLIASSWGTGGDVVMATGS
jgi:hypothetical protein